MADETKQEEVEGTAADVAQEEGENQASENNETGDNKKGEHSPVEEKYDLAKPLKKVDRPSREQHEAEMAALGEDIEKLKADRREVQNKIDAIMDSSRTSETSKVRDTLSKLRAQKGALINEKKAIRARLDATRNQSERLFEDKKATKASVKFTKIEDIDAEIKKLKRRQETTSMSLAEEKRLIKDIDSLQASKKLVEKLKTKEIDLEDAKEQRKLISVEIGEKDKEIDAVQAEIEESLTALKALSEKETDSRGQTQVLFAERDEIKKDLNDKHQERDNLRKEFREANNAWYDWQRAVRAQKKMQYEEEKRKREEERQEWLKQKEEEELKKIPYEEEMALCDYLTDYLTKTYLTDPKDSKQTENKKKDDVVEVKDDPFAGFKPMKKKDDDIFLKMGTGKKPRQRHAKKEKKANKSAPFRLNVDTFEQFGLLQLVPPTTIDMVEGSVAELKDKKKWFSEQPRGSVPTATEIRKANEKAAAQLKNRKADDGSSQAAASSKKKGDFSLSSDDFVPLGGSDTAPQQDMSVNSSWGNKAATNNQQPSMEDFPENDVANPSTTTQEDEDDESGE